jgi:ATP-dependent exoDNAse (exonuclease V) alpha subunit
LLSLIPEQQAVAMQIFCAVINDTNQLMFLQGTAGTGKTFTIKAVITALESYRKKCFIYRTTGIAAVQYPGGTTLHSLFHLGIDEQLSGGFRSNIGRGNHQAAHILAADLIIINEVFMLTSWVANRVSMTLHLISDQYRTEFGGKRILFVGNLL